jgi:hypothetical protein
MDRTKRDINQITQFEHDEKSNAKRVRMVGTEISIELDHKDGDSVTSHPAKLCASALGVDKSDDGKDIIPPLDCSSIRVLRVDLIGSGEIKVMVSPVDDGDVWRENTQQDTELIARRVKVVSISAEGDVHLVGRS